MSFGPSGFGKLPSGGGGAAGGFNFGDFMNLFGNAMQLGGLLGSGGAQPLPAPVANIPLMSPRGVTDEAPAPKLDDKIEVPKSQQGRRNFKQVATDFLDNTDDLFGSQGKVLGLGLLNQADPRLMYAAILANGLLNRPKE